MEKPKARQGSKLLIQEVPLQVLPGLAMALGLNEAIILQQLHYWLLRKSHTRDEREWYYNTYEDWKKQFPFWSVSTIKRTVISLEKSGVITTSNYNHSPIDKTKWYTINYDKLNELSVVTTAQNEPSTDHINLSTAQNEPSTDHIDPTTDHIDTLHGSDWPHQYPETTTEIKQDSLTTFESSSGPGSDTSLPDEIQSGKDLVANKAVAPKKKRPPKTIESIPKDHWLHGLLLDYHEHLDFAALDDMDWWATMAKSLPEGVFTRNFAALAFADLVLWLQANPLRTPRTMQTWRKRIHTSLNFYLDHKFSKRSAPNSTDHSPTTRYPSYADQKQAFVANEMDKFIHGGPHGGPTGSRAIRSSDASAIDITEYHTHE